MVRITLNGAACAHKVGTTIAELVAASGPAERRVAVERNGSIVPKSLHASTPLQDGDQIEVVQAIGGG